MSTSSADDGPRHSQSGRLSVEELARQQGVRPIASVDELARDDVFESDEELDEFLSFIQMIRHSNII
jgi:hypothetical protein